MIITKCIEDVILGKDGLTVILTDGTKHLLYDTVPINDVKLKKNIAEIITKENREKDWSELKTILIEKGYSEEQIKNHQKTFELGWSKSERNLKIIEYILEN